jgi:hypothetical protein
MRNIPCFGGIATTAIVFAALAPSAVAQENTTAWTCQDIGQTQPEPLGDREGHSVVVAEFSCHLESGPLAGGAATGTAIWEGDGPKLAMLAGSGVVRKPGATVVWNAAEAKLAFTMAEGKVTGWTVSGRGAWVLATGGWASMAGKPFTWTGKSVGPTQYTFETKSE